jgi:hypothetical protein
VLELKVHDGDREVVLQFEHSLLSMSKWESKHKKPFLSKEPKLHEMMIEYFQDMLLGDSDPDLVFRLSPEQLDHLSLYINDYPGASSVPKEDTKPPLNPEQVTSELIYYWLTALRIPFIPTESWHVNRILMLVQITNYKQTPEDKRKKRPDKDVMADWRVENERRLKMFKTKE